VFTDEQVIEFCNRWGGVPWDVSATGKEVATMMEDAATLPGGHWDKLRRELDEAKAEVKRLERLGNALREAVRLAVGDDAAGWEAGDGKPVGGRINRATKAWENRNATRAKDPTKAPIISGIEEIKGISGPDVAIVTLRTGHVLEIGDDGVTAWPSKRAQLSGENAEVIGGLAFNAKRPAAKCERCEPAEAIAPFTHVCKACGNDIEASDCPVCKGGGFDPSVVLFLKDCPECKGSGECWRRST
jgi:hypothetical protein